jgi:hypothetical protein
MDALFTEINGIRIDRPEHGCTGQSCRWCAYQDEVAEQAARPPRAKFDEAWLRAVTKWRKGLAIGDTFTADTLINTYGHPMGHPNQIGSLFSWWKESGIIKAVGRTPSKRASNHYRSIQVWEVTSWR